MIENKYYQNKIYLSNALFDKISALRKIGCARSRAYSYLSNKRSPTQGLLQMKISMPYDYSFWENIPGPTQLLETLRLFIFEKIIQKIGWK